MGRNGATMSKAVGLPPRMSFAAIGARRSICPVFGLIGRSLGTLILMDLRIGVTIAGARASSCAETASRSTFTFTFLPSIAWTFSSQRNSSRNSGAASKIIRPIARPMRFRARNVPKMVPTVIKSDQRSGDRRSVMRKRVLPSDLQGIGLGGDLEQILVKVRTKYPLLPTSRPLFGGLGRSFLMY